MAVNIKNILADGLLTLCNGVPCNSLQQYDIILDIIRYAGLL